MWGRTPSRQMNSPEKNPPTEWAIKGTKAADGNEIKADKNIKWQAQLGSQSYGNPVVAGGLVFVGTNNEAHRDPKYTVDGGVLMVFRESDGKFLWQRFSAKLRSGLVNDWPYQGICSTVFAEGDYIWYCTNRCEVVCLDISPLRKGTGEPKEIWAVDMMAQLGVFPCHMTPCSPVGFNNFIYVITANGIDRGRKLISAPDAPSVVCFDKRTSKVIWSDNSPVENVLHGQWSSPAIATINGRTQVIAPLGDGWVYGFDARTGEKIWWFDSNNKGTIWPTTRNELIATPVVVGNECYIANGQEPEMGEGPGHLWCIDITKRGDISRELSNAKPNPNSGVIWDFQGIDVNKNGKIERSERMNRSISTVAIANDLVFAPDYAGIIHCLDAKTGEPQWSYDMEAAVWGSPLVVDGKVYLCNEEGYVAIFEVSRRMKLIGIRNMGSSCYCSPVFANDTLYIMSRERVFAVKESK